MADTCPCCGAPATFIHGDEGTNAVVYDDTAVVALTTIRDAMRGWHEGAVADLGPDDVFKVADDALRAVGRS